MAICQIPSLLVSLVEKAGFAERFPSPTCRSAEDALTTEHQTYSFTPIAFVRSTLRERKNAPRQGKEGAPDVWLEFVPAILDGLDSIEVGQEIILITWLHRANRDVLKVHPRECKTAVLAGVFATRSPDRPNPLGLHRVTVLEIAGNRLKVGPLEAIDGTPVVDVKPVLPGAANGEN